MSKELDYGIMMAQMKMAMEQGLSEETLKHIVRGLALEIEADRHGTEELFRKNFEQYFGDCGRKAKVIREKSGKNAGNIFGPIGYDEMAQGNSIRVYDDEILVENKVVLNWKKNKVREITCPDGKVTFYNIGDVEYVTIEDKDTSVQAIKTIYNKPGTHTPKKSDGGYDDEWQDYIR